ncbi:6-phosphogluconate dehydrogenase (decarboxylating) like [Lecanosticta acicola]|uniref:6-phosphogluconate dehydrogenase, decarboxylating n=1 Tax=Lecanosticta acicola TaxID=111012 RepID=A0AAI9ECI5_9PEZI|nr:6-phosphogluconate dehydrogenase (decarboxylating) like [Lecanosticta acicola]
MAEIKKLAMIGCGSMGGGMALLFAENGCDVLLQDPSNEAMDKVLQQAEKDGVGEKLSKYQDYASMCRNLGSPKVFVWSLPHGDAGDKVLEGLMPFLEIGDVIIDAANEHWQNTERRMGKCVVKGIRYVGMGVSGGYQAARRGPSMCPGSDAETLDIVMPLLEKAAAKAPDGSPCVGRIGTGGAGHYCKMIHNGIEHGMMSAMAEAWAIMKKGLGMSLDEIGEELHRWNQSGELQGTFLVRIGAEICLTRDDKGERVLDTVGDKVVQDWTGEEGTGIWSNVEAIEQHVPSPTLSTAHFLRIASGDLHQRRIIHKTFGGAYAPQPLDVPDRKQFLEDLRLAVFNAFLCAYIQGMNIIDKADKQHHFHVDYPQLLQIWRAGCIIQADYISTHLLLPLYRDSRSKPNDKNPLFEPAVAHDLQRTFAPLKKIVAQGIAADHPIPALSATLEYLKYQTSTALPTSFYEAELDYFGKHMFDRWDDDVEGKPVTGKYHYEWKPA